MTNITPYPLCWPAGWPRTPAKARKNGKSKWSHGGKPWTFDAARRELADELDSLGAQGVILSTNYELRLDGQPRAGAPTPTDVGIAVYFSYKNRQVAMARDAYDRAEENIRSLTLAIRAMRAIEAHGGSLMMERAFEGFMSLPAPTSQRPWREVLGPVPGYAPVGGAWVWEKFKILAKKTHPDRGGSAAAMAELNVARAAALAEIRESGGSVW